MTGPAIAAGLSDTMAPDALVAEALHANPSLQAMHHQELALRARADVAGAWPDPMLTVEYSNVPVSSFKLSDHPMAGLQLKAQQTLRPPGWSQASRDVLNQRAEASAQAVAEAELGLSLMVRRTWWMLTRTRALREVTARHLARAEELLDAARARYETGAVGQHAVLRLEVLRDRLTDELGEFTAADAALTAGLAAALSAEPRRHFETPSAIDPIAPPSAADWLALAEAHRPAFAQLLAEEQAAEGAARVARLDALPDPSLWVGYRVRTAQGATDPGTDLVALGVGLPIPVGSARTAGGTQASALEEASAARARRAALSDAVESEMATIQARWQRAWDKVGAYDRSLIPGASATLEATQNDFAVGRADFASLFEAEVALLDLERARIVAAVDTHLQQAEAIAVLGVTPPGASP
ncbi:MAG: TolC family protein [Alphaproteobacteria bacterium]|nr:TolC family protein [Alphaproteobacteria bacterium]